jgi:hypothetical protein
MTALLLLLSAAQAFCQAQAQPQGADRVALMRQKHEELAGMATRLRSLLAQLDSVRKGYDDPGKFKGLSQEREAVRWQILELKSRYDPLAEEFNDLRVQDEKGRTAALLQGLASGTDQAARPPQDLVYYVQDMIQVSESTFELQRAVAKALTDEEMAFSDAEAAVAQRRRWMLTLCGAAAGLLVSVPLVRKALRHSPR